MRDSRTSSTLSRLLASSFWAFLGPVLHAQEGWRPDAYGTKVAIASYPASAFTMEHPSAAWSYDGANYRFSTFSSDPCFVAPVQLPSGVRILTMAVDGCDTSTTGNVGLFLHSCPTNLACVLEANAFSAGEPGCDQFAPSGTPLELDVNNMNHSYYLRVCNFSSDEGTKFRTVRLSYQLQLSPAPATATFADVPTTHLYFRAIEALAKSGITSGCGGGNFCPDQAVTRGEVAKFLAVALGLSWAP